MNRVQTGFKVIRDAVHGDIGFDKFELAIIDTPQFQRMRGIRQLGLGHLVYPSAHHCRFEHSLGVAHMAGRIAEVCKLEPEEKRFVRLLALIHDIGHIPFGHTMEDERPIYNKSLHHDETERLLLFLKGTKLENAINALGKDIQSGKLSQDTQNGKLGQDIQSGKIVESIIRLTKHTHEKGEEKEALSPKEKIYTNIVGNTICADLLDYLKRDPYFTGIHHSYDEKIISAFRIENSKICLDLQDGNQVRHGVLSEILHLLRLRYTLGERVYYHATKASASAMISKAVELSELPHEALARLRDDELLYILENASPRTKVIDWTIKNTKQAAYLVKSIRCRSLYEPVYTITRGVAGHYLDDFVEKFYKPENREQRKKIEKDIAKYAKLGSHQIIIYCPDGKMSTKAAEVEVLWPKESGPIPLEELCKKKQGIEDENTHEEIEQLKRKHEALWRLSVFVDPLCEEKFKDVVAFCESSEEFNNIKNQNQKHILPPKIRLLEHSLYRAIEQTPEGDVVYPETVQGLQVLAESKHFDSETLGIDKVQNQIVEPPQKIDKEGDRNLFDVDKNVGTEDTMDDDGVSKE